MPSIQQADWFTKNLMRHWPSLDRQRTSDAIQRVSEFKYEDLKRIYRRAFVEKTPGDIGARGELDNELYKLGLLN
jgi:hypothetical protein